MVAADHYHSCKLLSTHVQYVSALLISHNVMPVEGNSLVMKAVTLSNTHTQHREQTQCKHTGQPPKNWSFAFIIVAASSPATAFHLPERDCHANCTNNHHRALPPQLIVICSQQQQHANQASAISCALLDHDCSSNNSPVS